MNTHELNYPSPYAQGTSPTQPAFLGSPTRTSRARTVLPNPPPRAAAARFPTAAALYSNPILTLVCADSALPAPHSLGSAAYLTGVHPEMLRYYCRIGLLGPHREETAGDPTFDDDALDEIGRIEHYRRNLGVNRRALPLICQLWRECERQQIDLYFLRSPRPHYGDGRRSQATEEVHAVRVTPHGPRPLRGGKVSGWVSALRNRLHA